MKGSRPFVLTTGSHIHTVWFGSLADDGTQLFKQYPNADSDSFLDYLNHLRRKYTKMVQFLDKATYYRKEKCTVVDLKKTQKNNQNPLFSNRLFRRPSY